MDAERHYVQKAKAAVERLTNEARRCGDAPANLADLDVLRAYVDWSGVRLERLERLGQIEAAARDAERVMSNCIYPKPDVPPDHPYAVLERLRKALAILRRAECPHPARDGRHEAYLRPDGSSVCRACGAELGRAEGGSDDGSS